MNQRIVVLRLKGKAGLKREIQDTLKMLRLYKKYSCVVISNTENYVGMIRKVKDCTTWGEIDLDTFKLLLEKRGRLHGNNKLNNEYLKDKLKLSIDDFSKDCFSFKKELKEVPGLKLFFRLSPPRHGLEEKGTKADFAMGGSLGYRKDKINELIRRMV